MEFAAPARPKTTPCVPYARLLGVREAPISLSAAPCVTSQNDLFSPKSKLAKMTKNRVPFVCTPLFRLRQRRLIVPPKMTRFFSTWRAGTPCRATFGGGGGK